MAYTAYQSVVLDSTSGTITAVDTPAITVRLESTGGLATLYSDEGGTALTNPFNGNSDGSFLFYVESGFYQITSTKGAYTDILSDVPIGQLQGKDSLPYENLTQAIAGDEAVGSIIRTGEYISGSGIGGGVYEKVNTNPLNSLINPATSDGKWLKLLGNKVDIAQAGVVFDDSTDNSTAINQCCLAFRYVTNKQSNGGIARAEGINVWLDRSVFVNEGILKLVDASTEKLILKVAGDDILIIGGFWDGNRTSGAQTTGSNWWDHHLVKITANNQRSKVKITGYNAAGIGVGAASSCTFLNIDGNTLYDCDKTCIYVPNNLYTTINNNDLTANIASINSPNQHNCILVSATVITDSAYIQVNNNNCLGMLSSHDAVNNLIAVKGYNCQVNSNLTRGGSMGISVNQATYCVVNGNLIMDTDDTGTTSGMGIELNGGNNSVSGNVIRGGDQGIVSSTTKADPLDNNVISGNTILDVRQGILIGTHATVTCENWTITGNSIISEEECIFTTDAEGFTITGNSLETTTGSITNILFKNPSSLDLKTTISNNTQTGGTNIFRIFDDTGVPKSYSGVVAKGNTYISMTDVWPAFITDASAGAGISYDKVVSNVRYDYADVLNDIVNVYGYGATPEAAIAASKGSMCTAMDGNIYRKTTDAVNTGWVAM